MPRPRRRKIRVKKTDWYKDNSLEPDYKRFDFLRRFVSERGKILSRRATGLKAKNQRKLAGEVKRARHLALLPFVNKNVNR
ncbi:MAG: 30S ribosomal protein S18 [Chitinivibrionales bacterium]|nr:30S ribosomal protein S18 [Chitinivibrionales bacterium]